MIFRQFLLLETAEEEKAVGCFEVMPENLRPVFRDDLDNFIAEIEAGEGGEYSIVGDDAQTYMSARTAVEHSGMILSATIAMLLGWWAGPVLPWRSSQICKGCEIFLSHVKDSPSLVETLWIEKWPACTEKQKLRIEEAMRMSHVWKEITRTNFYLQPARNLLARWALEAIQMVHSLIVNGGGVNEYFEKTCHVSYSRSLD